LFSVVHGYSCLGWGDAAPIRPEDFIVKLEPDLIFLNQENVTRDELFTQVSQQLLNKGLVKESYLDAIIARENDHPTAMQLANMVVAIPHVDVEHVNEERLVVATSKSGIEFKSAEEFDATVDSNVIFFLLLKNKDDHLQFLVKLMGLFRQSDVMNKLLNATTPNEIISTLNESLV
jgi:galactitol PTS system EIIA component